MEIKKISIIIPCHNEEGSIVSVLDSMPNIPEIFEIIVVNDGSTDLTVEAVERSKREVKVVSHAYNIGNGAAVKTGARNARGDYLLFMDGDGQHQPEDIVKLIDNLKGYDMVIGARSSKAKVSSFRSIGNFVFNNLASYLTRKKIKDLTSGFRLVNRKKFMEFIDLYPNQYSYPTTSTLAFIKTGYFVKFVELDTITRRKKGESKISPMKDGLKFINIILKVVILFSPMRFFFPVFLLFFTFSVIVAFYQLSVGHKLSSISVVLFLFSFQVFFIGLVLEQISYFFKKNNQSKQ